jgi:hypothetical protein
VTTTGQRTESRVTEDLDFWPDPTRSCRPA